MSYPIEAELSRHHSHSFNVQRQPEDARYPRYNDEIAVLRMGREIEGGQGEGLQVQ